MTKYKNGDWIYLDDTSDSLYQRHGILRGRPYFVLSSYLWKVDREAVVIRSQTNKDIHLTFYADDASPACSLAKALYGDTDV